MKLSDFIKTKGDTSSSLSKKLGISYTTIYEGLKNPKQLKYENLMKLAKYYNITLDYLSEMIEDQEITLLSILRDQMESKLKGNIYHFTQVNFAYNTNRIEGSKLSEDQTRMMFETNTIGTSGGEVNTDDLVETANSFYLFDEMLKVADNHLSEEMIKRFHQILKNGTNDSRKDWFAVGEYKKLPNEVGGRETTHPKDVFKDMKKLLLDYNLIQKPNLEDVVDFHYKFERIHPFQDGNGRIGRLIMFKECLRLNIVPFIIEDSKKAFYYRGLDQYTNEKGFLVETCLAMQDNYKEVIKKYLEGIFEII